MTHIAPLIVDAPATPPVLPRLWNPNAAANWSLLFTPIFGAYLHAANWRALGQTERAARSVAWARLGMIFLVVNLASVFAPESGAVVLALRCGGAGLLIAWYFTQARPQVRYVRETHGDEYDRRGWGVPLLAGVLGWVAYVGLVLAAMSAVAVLRPVTAAGLAEQIRPLIQLELRNTPAALDATVHRVTLAREGGDTYAGTADATVAGRPQKFTVKVVNASPMMQWQAHPVPPDLGTLISYKNDCLYYTFPVSAAEANALGEYLSKSGFFVGTGKVVQLTKYLRTYQICTPVNRGFDQDPEVRKVSETFARELSGEVFHSSPTEIHLCDVNLVTLRVVAAK